MLGLAGGAGVDGIRPGGLPLGSGVEGMPITGRWRTIATSTVAKSSQFTATRPRQTIQVSQGDLRQTTDTTSHCER